MLYPYRFKHYLWHLLNRNPITIYICFKFCYIQGRLLPPNAAFIQERTSLASFSFRKKALSFQEKGTSFSCTKNGGGGGGGGNLLQCHAALANVGIRFCSVMDFKEKGKF